VLFGYRKCENITSVLLAAGLPSVNAVTFNSWHCMFDAHVTRNLSCMSSHISVQSNSVKNCSHELHPVMTVWQCFINVCQNNTDGKGFFSEIVVSKFLYCWCHWSRNSHLLMDCHW